MAIFLLTSVLCFTGISAALAEWSYNPNAADGPSNWGGLCNGSNQSPININSTAAQYDSGLRAFTLVNYNSKPAGVSFTALNNGHTLEVSFPDRIFNVSGGGLTGTYTTVQFHLHWGSTNSKGSEHTLDGQRYSAEIHFVSYNTKYANISTALLRDDGLAVLGVFLKLGYRHGGEKIRILSSNGKNKKEILFLPREHKAGSSNVKYDMFLNSARSLVNKDSSLILPAIFELQNLLPTDRTKYYRYSGSLTTPTCNEVVTWTVFKDPVEISTAQLESLRSLKKNSSMQVVDNFRNIQSIGSRIVKLSFQESDLNPTEAGGVVKISNVILLLMLFGALFLR